MNKKRVNLSRIDNVENNGTEFLIDASKENGFNFPFVLFISDSIKNNCDLLVGIQTVNPSFSNFDDSINEILEHKDRQDVINGSNIKLSQMFKSIVLVPIIPRTVGFDPTYLGYSVYKNDYTDAYLAVDSNYSTYKKEDYDNFKNLDKQLINMIDYAKLFIQKNGIVVNDKVILNGYSATSHFVNFFSALHPDIVSMVIGGGTGGASILPIKEYNNYILDYPVGINDIDFDLEEFKRIKHFYYLGNEDNDLGPATPKFEKIIDGYDENNNPIFKRDKFGNLETKKDENGNNIYILDKNGNYQNEYKGYYTNYQINAINHIAKDTHDLFNITSNIYKENGINCIFKLYKGDHSTVFDNEELYDDILNMYNKEKTNIRGL